MLATAGVGAVIFAAAALLGVVCAKLICARVKAFADGPPPSRPRPRLMIVLMAVVGGCVALHGFAASLLAVGAITAFALTGCWYCDLARGIVPDYFTLLPLGFVLVFAAVQSEWRVLISAAVPFVPFALAALLSRGRGMGWGDAKLVALGGAVLGAQVALLAFALSCFAACVVSRVVGRPGAPIAFAPYLVIATALALALGMYT